MHFIDLDGDKADALKELCGSRNGAFVYTGDANEILVKKVLPRCQRENYRRAFCLLDPYGLQVRWEVLVAAARTQAVEVVYHLSAQAINRNIRRDVPDAIPAEFRARFTSVWGDESWIPVLFERSRGLFDEVEERRDYRVVAEAFRKRLKDVAGFAYVEKPLLLTNRTNAPLYWLFFAGPNATGAKIVKEIFAKYQR